MIWEVPYVVVLALHLLPSVVVVGLGIYLFREMRPRIVWRWRIRKN